MSNVEKAVTAFDIVTAKAIGRLPRQWYGFFSFVGFVVRPSLWIFIALVCAGVFVSRNLTTFALLSFVTALLVPVSTAIKLFFRRQRPVTIYTEAMKIKSYSFPSSHSYSAALVASLLCMCAVFFFVTWSGLIIAFLVFLVLTVAVSRVFVGAHYPSDVIGGVLLGILIQGVLLAAFFL